MEKDVEIGVRHDQWPILLAQLVTNMYLASILAKLMGQTDDQVREAPIQANNLFKEWLMMPEKVGIRPEA